MKKEIPTKKPHTIDISGQFILLGTGTSVGVPALGCSCQVCLSGDPKNNRTRCSAVIGLPQGNLLIDTSPDLRHQLLREKIGVIHAVAYTHEHSDHVMGFDDLRLFQFYLGHPVPVYCNEKVESRLRSAFDYAFSEVAATHVGATPSIDLHRIDRTPFQVLGATITPIPLKHGPRFNVLGFRIGDIAYCTDTSEIPEESWPLLEGVKTLIIDALRPEPHVTHLSIPQAIEVAQKVGAEETYFTHCACKIDYAETNATLPPNIQVGYDGLKIPLDFGTL